MILLIQPYCFSLTSHPPIGLGYLASSLKKHKRDSVILDMQFNSDWQQFNEMIWKEHLEWIGLSVSYQNFLNAKYIIERIKCITPDIPVIIGGAYASTLPDFCLEALKADFVVIGEGEETIIELDSLLMAGRPIETIPGIAYLRNNTYRQTKGASFIQDLDCIPMPDYTQIPPGRYSRVPWQIFKKGNIVGPILTSRGCPFNCSFCAASTIMGKKWRRRSMASVGEEMQYLHDHFGVDEFHVVDDNLVGTREHAIAFCEEILRRNLRIHWKTPNGVRSHLLDNEILALMKRSGCYMLGFGIESGDKTVLEHVNKNINLDLVKEKISLAKSNNIITFGYFIVGFPYDTETSIKRTIQVAMDFPLDLAHFGYFIPFPGSEIFNMLQRGEQKTALDNPWVFSPNPPEGMSESRLRSLQRKAYFKFFLRPNPLLTMFRLFGYNKTSLSGFFRAVLYYFTSKRVRSTQSPSDFTIATKLKIFVYNFFVKPRLVIFFLEGMQAGYNIDKSIVKNYVDKTSGKVLDVGCGEAPFARIIPPDRYIGIDKKLSAIKTAEYKFPDHIFIHQSFLNNHMPGGKYDLIIISKVLHHLSREAATSIVNHFSGQLTDNGYLLIFEPLAPLLSKNFFHKIWFSTVERGRSFWSINQLEAILSDKFEIIESNIYKKRPIEFYYVVLKKREDK